MKKFLSKKPVMISFIVAAALFLAVYIGMLVRPVSYGFNYVNKTTEEGISLIEKINFKSDKVARQTSITKQEGKDDIEMVVDTWIYRDGDKIYVVGVKEYVDVSDMDEAEVEIMKDFMPEIKEEDYKTIVKVLEAAKDKGETEFKLALDANSIMGEFEVGLFKCGEDDAETKDVDESYTNTQAIVFTVVHGVVTVALVTFATLSLVFFIKRKKA